MSDLVDVELTVNGVRRFGKCEPRKLLADFLREDLALTGTHVGCEHGICGACTIIFNDEAVRSCIMFAVQANGGEVGTIEGIAKDGKLHPLQEAFHEHHGLQCGFCTPGMLNMALDFLQREIPRLRATKFVKQCRRSFVAALGIAILSTRSPPLPRKCVL